MAADGVIFPACGPTCSLWCVSVNCLGVVLSQLGVVFLQEPLVVLGCVQLLQSLAQHRQHVKDLPSKTMMDILNEVLCLIKKTHP